MFAEEGGKSILFAYVGQVECSKAASLHPCIYFRTLGDKQFSSQSMPLIHSLMQRDPTAHIPCIDICTMDEEQFNDIDVPPKSCGMQRGVLRPGLRVRIHTGIQVSFDRFDVSVEGGLVNQHRGCRPTPHQQHSCNCCYDEFHKPEVR